MYKNKIIVKLCFEFVLLLSCKVKRIARGMLKYVGLLFLSNVRQFTCKKSGSTCLRSSTTSIPTYMLRYKHDTPNHSPEHLADL